MRYVLKSEINFTRPILVTLSWRHSDGPLGLFEDDLQLTFIVRSSAKEEDKQGFQRVSFSFHADWIEPTWSPKIIISS